MTFKKKVLVGGCFDLIHYGHIVFLKNARALGDYLIVALEADETTKRLKGANRPIHTQKQRREMLLSLSFVDRIISLPEMKSDKDYEDLVKKVRPQIIAITEGDPLYKKKASHAKKVMAKIVVLPKIKVNSTSQIFKLLKIE